MQADFLPFDLTRIAGHEAGTAEFGLQRGVIVDQRPRDAVAHGTGGILSTHATVVLGVA